MRRILGMIDHGEQITSESGTVFRTTVRIQIGLETREIVSDIPRNAIMQTMHHSELRNEVLISDVRNKPVKPREISR